MKYFIAIAFVAAIVAVNAAGIDIPEAHKEKAKQIADECRAAIPVTDEEFAKLKAGEVYDASENAKCFTNCFQEKAGILKDNVFQKDAALAKFTASLGEEKAKTIVTNCSGESDSAKCGTAYSLHQCFKKNEAY